MKKMQLKVGGIAWWTVLAGKAISATVFLLSCVWMPHIMMAMFERW